MGLECAGEMTLGMIDISFPRLLKLLCFIFEECLKHTLIMLTIQNDIPDARPSVSSAEILSSAAPSVFRKPTVPIDTHRTKRWTRRLYPSQQSSSVQILHQLEAEEMTNLSDCYVVVFYRAPAATPGTPSLATPGMFIKQLRLYGNSDSITLWSTSAGDNRPVYLRNVLSLSRAELCSCSGVMLPVEETAMSVDIASAIGDERRTNWMQAGVDYELRIPLWMLSNRWPDMWLHHLRNIRVEIDAVTPGAAAGQENVVYRHNSADISQPTITGLAFDLAVARGITVPPTPRDLIPVVRPRLFPVTLNDAYKEIRIPSVRNVTGIVMMCPSHYQRLFPPAAGGALADLGGNPMMMSIFGYAGYTNMESIEIKFGEERRFLQPQSLKFPTGANAEQTGLGSNQTEDEKGNGMWVIDWYREWTEGQGWLNKETAMEAHIKPICVRMIPPHQPPRLTSPQDLVITLNGISFPSGFTSVRVDVIVEEYGGIELSPNGGIMLWNL